MPKISRMTILAAGLALGAPATAATTFDEAFAHRDPQDKTTPGAIATLLTRIFSGRAGSPAIAEVARAAYDYFVMTGATK